MFNNGDDLHGRTAVEVFHLDCDPKDVKKLYPSLRNAAKVIRFRNAYGGGARGLAEGLIAQGVNLYADEYTQMYGITKPKRVGNRTIDIPELVAQAMLDDYNAAYPAVAKYVKDTLRFAKEFGYCETVLGRRRMTPNINDEHNHKERSFDERVCKNSPVQGSAADMINSAMVRIEFDEVLRNLKYQMVLQIHDEIVGVCPANNVEKAKERVCYLMAHPFGDSTKLRLDFPAEADSGKSYAEAK